MTQDDGQRPFTHFVILAEMRTGSNFLEANLARLPDLALFGEAFNPHFIGGPKRDELFGITLPERERDPHALLKAMIAADPDRIAGFRFFHDHDPRILKTCLADRACAKVVLTRNPLDSYVSRKIAAVTGQWKLTNVKHRKAATIRFDADEFTAHLADLQAFQLQILRSLQDSGQTAFYIHYDDLNTLSVLNGLARFLGSRHRLEKLDDKLKRQNPAPLRDKVENYDQMVQALAGIDFMNLTRTPNFEPRRGAMVPRHVAADRAGLLFVPLKGAPEARVLGWMAAVEGCDPAGLTGGFDRNSLKEWRLARPGFRSFTVLAHPAVRAHRAFCEHILPAGKGAYRDIRKRLIRDFGVAIPKDGRPDPGYDLDAHRKAFLAFLAFLKANLAGQTGIRIDPAWASQSALIEGVAAVNPLHHLLREERLSADLTRLAEAAGLDAANCPEPPVSTRDAAAPFPLAQVMDRTIAARIRDIYARDYVNFGFGDWTPTGDGGA